MLHNLNNLGFERNATLHDLFREAANTHEVKIARGEARRKRGNLISNFFLQ